jgi:hypothetical protein
MITGLVGVTTTTGFEPPQPDNAPNATSAPMPANKLVFFIFLPFLSVLKFLALMQSQRKL